MFFRIHEGIIAFHEDTKSIVRKELKQGYTHNEQGYNKVGQICEAYRRFLPLTEHPPEELTLMMSACVCHVGN